MTKQVFGPGRPAAAMAAIGRLEKAKEDALFACWTDEGAQRRLREAERVRAMYADYGDTFRGH